MTTIQFGPWLPDLADLGNRGVTVATNVLPSRSGYAPFPQLVLSTNALDARPRGAIQARDKDGNVYQFAGDASKLYENQSNTWTDVSKSGGYSTGDEEHWEFAPWKNKVLATNFDDNPQQITFGGANFSDLTTDFKARHITVIRDFVVFANTFDSSDGNVPSRVRWSAFNDETDYTVSTSTLSDFQDLKTAAVDRIFGGEFGVVLQTNSVWRMSFVGVVGSSPVVFQFDEVLPGIGIIAPGAAAQDGDIIYFLSNRGFIALRNGAEATPIGANRVDKFVLDDLDDTQLHRITATTDPEGQRVFFAYPSGSATGGRPDKIVCYDRTLDRWSLIERDVELLWRAGSLGFDLDTDVNTEDQDLDADLPSFDSRFYTGGASQLGAFDEDFKAGLFNGDNMSATIETAEVEMSDGRRTRLNGIRPLIDGGLVTAQIATRNRQTDTASFGSAISLRDSGRIPVRANAMYLKARFNLTGAWTHAIGVNVPRHEVRQGARRG